ncbi:GTPase Era, mitochondrial-like isoform X1 [Amphibalanus amphitrite]|uniref:GTPase Era, mitochondrial-like isoform X1 n=1 Tax=Amphibalanus amphitrite TaxID=1232801 RepID=UPI001C9244E6|nr:GTPase Era, mitochondrial-like isoform X1 [Amphibalanus amphitrite]
MPPALSVRLWWPGTTGFLPSRARLSVSAAAAVRTARQSWEPRAPRRRVPVTEDEAAALRRRPPGRPEARCLSVAVLGIPNSGKSTVINRLLSWPVCSVSSKVHTTQTNSRAALTIGDTQLVLEDTPGLVTDAERRRHRLDPATTTEPLSALRRADLVCVLHDVSDPRCRAGLSPKVQRLLFAEPSRPAVLVLTKVDMLARKRRLLELTRQLTDGLVDGVPILAEEKKPRPRRLDADRLLRDTAISNSDSSDGESRQPPDAALDREEQLRAAGVELAEGYVDRGGPLPPLNPEHRRLVLAGQADQLSEADLDALSRRWRAWPLFRRVFMTAALEGAGVSALTDYLLSAARPAGWRVSGELVTDRRPRQLAEDAVRAALLEHLPAEVPYCITCQVTQWDQGAADVLAVEMRLQCTRMQHSRVVLRKIRAVARDAEQRLRDAFRAEVTLRLDVRPSPPGWGGDRQ